MVASIDGIAARLRIQPGHRVVAVVGNAPPDRTLVISITGEVGSGDADVVIGFATEPADVVSLNPVYTAALEGRLAWLGYRPDTDMRSDWLARAVHRYGVQPVDQVVIDDAWSALLLQPTGQEVWLS